MEVRQRASPKSSRGISLYETNTRSVTVDQIHVCTGASVREFLPCNARAIAKGGECVPLGDHIWKVPVVEDVSARIVVVATTTGNWGAMWVVVCVRDQGWRWKTQCSSAGYHAEQDGSSAFHTHGCTAAWFMEPVKCYALVYAFGR